jgi:hypothetical protein
MSEDYTVHAARLRAAQLRAVTHGTCDLCGQFMVHGTVEGVTDAWHPDPVDATVCPPIPDVTRDPEGWALATNLGLTPGHPGAEHFRPTHVIDLAGEWAALTPEERETARDGAVFTEAPDA